MGINHVQNSLNKMANAVQQKMMQAKGKQQKISTSDGKYYAGMTKADAEKKGNYSIWHKNQDFKSIDKDNNGVLSDREILAARAKESFDKRAVADVRFVTTLGISAILGWDSEDREMANNIDAESKKYKQQHNIKD